MPTHSVPATARGRGKRRGAGEGKRRRGRFAPDRARILAATLLLFALVLALFGGASRYDEFAQTPVRLMALIVIAVASFSPLDHAPRALRVPALVLAAAIAWVALQLVPLPPSIWTSLPGRAPFVEAAAAAGIAQPWRPLALSPDLAFNALLSLAVPAAAMYGAAALAPRYRGWTWPVLLAGLAFALLAGAIQEVGNAGGFSLTYDVLFKGSPSGIFTNRNHQALLLAAGLPLLAAIPWRAQQGTQGGIARAVAAGVALVLVVVLVGTGSRAGLLLGLVGLAGAAAILWSARRRQAQPSAGRWQKVLIAALAVAVIAALAAAILLGRASAVERMMGDDPTADLRLRALPVVLELAGRYFPTGAGFGAFDAAYRQVEPLSLLQPAYFNQAHNDLLQTALEGGAPAVLILLAAIAWLAIGTWRVWRVSTAHPEIVRARGASVILLMMVIASAIDYPLRTPTMMAIAAVLSVQLALGLDEVRRGVTTRPAARP